LQFKYVFNHFNVFANTAIIWYGVYERVLNHVMTIVDIAIVKQTGENMGRTLLRFINTINVVIENNCKQFKSNSDRSAIVWL